MYDKKYNSVDLVGQKYGQLMVLRKLKEKTKSRGVLWLCECDCGNTIKLPSNSLTSGNTTSCGDKKHKRSARYGDIPLGHIKRNREFSVSPAYLWDLFLKQDKKCALSGETLVFTQANNANTYRKETTASLDRIDSSKGYIEGNVRWIHKDINKMRSDKDDKQFIDLCRKCVKYSYEGLNRPTWNEYFLMLAFDIALRSEDINIKHGAVIVNSKNHIIGTGYNGPIKGSINSMIPMHIRDEKRKWMIHAEENAILNTTQNPSDIDDNTRLYVTGLPCNNCLQRIINFGIKKIIMANRMGSVTEDDEAAEMRRKLVEMSKIEIITIDVTNTWIKKNLH